MTDSILIVDDIVNNLRVLSQTLKKAGYKVRSAKDGSTALQVAEKVLPDLILLDIKMPGMDGYAVCQKLKANPATKEIPVIFLSALDEVSNKVKAFEVGGVDYINKPFNSAEVLVRVQNQLALGSAKKEVVKLNQELTVLNQQLELKVRDRTKDLKFKNQQLQAVNQKLTREIQARQEAEQKLVRDALHDGLTDLPNRTFLMQKIENFLQQAVSDSEYLFALLFIDIDRFKVINDVQGHATGDRLLVQFSHLLAKNLRKGDILARLGGDEFVILLDNLASHADATKVAERVNQQLGKSLEIEGQTVSVSIGVAFSNSDYKNASEVLRDADIAMYRAKAKGKNCYEVFNRRMYFETLQKIELEKNLHAALNEQQFCLYYQPIICLANEALMGFEALIRWQHPQRGFISPGDFIPVAEDTGLIVPISDWVLQEACEQLSIWQQRFRDLPNIDSLVMSVNIASQHLEEADFVQKLDKTLNATKIDGSCLKLELTERVLVDSGQSTSQTIEEIKRRNVELSIDDFGTGYSSLSYLHHFPIDNLKIDRSFVSRLTLEVESLEIVKAIITLAHTLNLDAIAEGVETPEQAALLKALSCEYAQGYLFSKPLSAAEIEATILRQFAIRTTPRL